MLDFVQRSGLVGLERLRTDVPWIVRRLYVHDDEKGLLLHPDLAHFAPARMLVRGLLENRPRPPVTARTAGRVTAESVEAPRFDPRRDLRAEHFPRYEELVREGFARAGWGTPDDFRGHRASIACPLAPSEVVLMSEIGGG